MSLLYPTPEDITAAIDWAIAERRTRARRTATGMLLTESALHERVSGYAIRPEPYGIGWWIVGVLVDTTDVECHEYSIITVPGGAMARTKPRYESQQAEVPKPSRWYFSGTTKRWECNPDVPGDNDPPGFHGQ
jgi:hypothetical protein